MAEGAASTSLTGPGWRTCGLGRSSRTRSGLLADSAVVSRPADHNHECSLPALRGSPKKSWSTTSRRIRCTGRAAIGWQLLRASRVLRPASRWLSAECALLLTGPAAALYNRHYRVFMTGRRALSRFRSAATAPSEHATAPRAVRSHRRRWARRPRARDQPQSGSAPPSRRTHRRRRGSHRGLRGRLKPVEGAQPRVPVAGVRRGGTWSLLPPGVLGRVRLECQWRAADHVSRGGGGAMPQPGRCGLARVVGALRG